MPTNQPPPFRRNKPIMVQAEGDREIEQLIRRMKAGAWRIEGGAMVAFGSLLIPFVWTDEPIAATRIRQIEAFHQKPDGGYWQDIRLETEWDLSVPGSLPQPIDEAIARLNVRFYRSDGQEAAVSFWFDASYNKTILASVADTGRLMICPSKPTIPQLQTLATSEHITIEMERTGELKKFLATVQPKQKRQGATDKG